MNGDEEGGFGPQPAEGQPQEQDVNEQERLRQRLENMPELLAEALNYAQDMVNLPQTWPGILGAAQRPGEVIPAGSMPEPAPTEEFPWPEPLTPPQEMPQEFPEPHQQPQAPEIPEQTTAMWALSPGLTDVMSPTQRAMPFEGEKIMVPSALSVPPPPGPLNYPEMALPPLPESIRGPEMPLPQVPGEVQPSQFGPMGTPEMPEFPSLSPGPGTDMSDLGRDLYGDMQRVQPTSPFESGAGDLGGSEALSLLRQLAAGMAGGGEQMGHGQGTPPGGAPGELQRRQWAAVHVPDLDAEENFPLASPSVQSSTRQGLRGAGGTDYGSRYTREPAALSAGSTGPARTSLVDFLGSR